MIDQAKESTYLAHQRTGVIRARGDLLAPEDYFDGYEEEHCTICANNQNSISTSAFCARLADIAARPDVGGVFVRFYDYKDALDDTSCWIGSDSVYVITSATIDSVRQWFVDFEASNVSEELELAKFVNLPNVLEGNRLVAVWWDSAVVQMPNHGVERIRSSPAKTR